tara:strand:+ start:406 stop:1176 length:771 start_codon:yes stop_codon:yes gene_type:complete
MKNTVKKLVIKAMRMPHIQYINKEGYPIIRKQELQHMICQAQKMIEHKNKPLGKTSNSVWEFLDRNGDTCFHHSTGFYNVAMGKWVDEGLLTRSREDGYKITELGRLFASTDTRAYEIEKWKSKFKSEVQRANRLNSQVNDLMLEKRKLHDRVDEIYFGKEFMDSDDKGTLKDYDDTRDIAIRCVDKLVDAKILEDVHQFETQDTIHDEINKEFNIPNFDECQSIVTTSPPNSIINTCLSNMQESLNCITQHINKE